MIHFSLFARIRLVLLFIIVGLVNTATIAAEIPSFSVATELLPPYQYIDDQGNMTGYAVELVQAILDDLESSEEIWMYPWARTYKLATSRKNVLVFSLARTPERESLFHWIGEIHHENYTLFALKSNQEINVNSLEDATTYNVAVTRSSVAEHILTRLGFNSLEKTDSFEQCITMLLRKNSDLILASDYALKHQHFTQRISTDEIRRVYSLDGYSSGLYLAMSEDSDQALIDKLRASFQKFEKNGTIARLKLKWKL
jgi:polar amino acid transport system substrate-binding protein